MTEAATPDITSSSTVRAIASEGAIPPYFDGSHILDDLISAVVSAMHRVSNGENKSFGKALYRVLADMDTFNNFPEHAQMTGTFHDWNAPRAAEFRMRDAVSRRRGGLILS